LSRPASAAGVPSSETRVKRGDRVVGIDTELIEKPPAATTRAPAARAAGFRQCCRSAGHFDDAQGNYYSRDQ
jgi:hypothetical protein